MYLFFTYLSFEKKILGNFETRAASNDQIFHWIYLSWIFHLFIIYKKNPAILKFVHLWTIKFLYLLWIFHLFIIYKKKKKSGNFEARAPLNNQIFHRTYLSRIYPTKFIKKRAISCEQKMETRRPGELNESWRMKFSVEPSYLLIVDFPFIYTSIHLYRGRKKLSNFATDYRIIEVNFVLIYINARRVNGRLLKFLCICNLDRWWREVSGRK